MNTPDNNIRFAQSASALGAGLLGFGIGAKWGAAIDNTILLIVLIIGAIIHIAGMYVVHVVDYRKAGTVARVLWISAWICLIVLVGMFIYIVIR